MFAHFHLFLLFLNSPRLNYLYIIKVNKVKKSSDIKKIIRLRKSQNLNQIQPEFTSNKTLGLTLFQRKLMF